MTGWSWIGGSEGVSPGDGGVEVGEGAGEVAVVAVVRAPPNRLRVKQRKRLAIASRGPMVGSHLMSSLPGTVKIDNAHPRLIKMLLIP